MAISLTQKTVFITGASSGIGEAAAQHLAQQGANLILTARRLDRLIALADRLQTEYGIKALPIQLNVQDKQAVADVIAGLPQQWQQIDILVNNAGFAVGTTPIQQGNVDDWDAVIATNVQGLLYVTRHILPGMIERNGGHIVNIGSVAGHECYPAGNIYSMTKHAVKAISTSLRLDLLGKPIRVSEIDPGAVHTEFSQVRWQDKQKADAFYEGFQPLVADDIAEAVVYCVTRPLHVNVSTMVIFPTAQASCNHLSKQSESAASLFD